MFTPTQPSPIKGEGSQELTRVDQDDLGLLERGHGHLVHAGDRHAVAGLGPDAPVTDGYVADLQAARDAGSLQEHFALVFDGSNVATSVMPRGVAAAERTTLGPSLEGR